MQFRETGEVCTSLLPRVTSSVKRGIVIVHVRLFVTSRDAQRKARYSDRARPSVCYLA